MTTMLLNSPLAAAVAGREHELQRLVNAAIEGETTFVTAADPALAAALVDACADELAKRSWSVVRVDARLANDETDLARMLAVGVAQMSANSPFRIGPADSNIDMADPHAARTRVLLRSLLGERAFALLEGGDDAPTGVEAVASATEAFVSVRGSSRTVLALLGVDELIRPGRSRFTVGAEALWAFRGAWQMQPGPVLMSGASALAAMTVNPDHAFYGYGQLHESQPLSDHARAAAYAQLLAGRVHESAHSTVAYLLEDALWLVPDLLARLPKGKPADIDMVRQAWSELISAREPELFALLRTASHVHRLAVPVLKALARAERPYATLGRQGISSSDVSRVLSAMEAYGLLNRRESAQWRFNDPALAELLRRDIRR